MIFSVYHLADHDGRCSAAIVRKKYPDCELIGINYGMPFPWDRISADDTVIMSDFSLEPIDRMIHLNKKCNFIWIDHHKSAIDVANAADFNPAGLRVIGKSGCELTWEFLFPGEKVPRGVHLIGRHDVWDKSRPDAMSFQYGLTVYDTDPTSDIWKKILSYDEDEFIEDTLRRGAIIFQYVEKVDAEYLDGYCFEATLHGFRCLVLNRARCGSTVFASKWDPEKYDMMVMFAHDGTGINVSLYSDKPGVDVIQLAKRFGGGGHPGASGFRIDNIPVPVKELVYNKNTPLKET